MALTGSYFVLDNPEENIKDVKCRDNGNEYAFDIDYEGYKYTVTLKRERGSLFQGTATLPSGWSSEVSARVFEDKEQGIVIFRGYKWREDNSNYNWLIELDYE